MKFLLNRFISIFIHFLIKYKIPIKIYFSGGLGNQILTYTVFRYLKSKGANVGINIDYYVNSNIRKHYIKNGVSIFNWELQEFIDLNLDDLILKSKIFKKKNYFKIGDGVIKLFIANQASKENKIKEYFKSLKFENLNLKDLDFNMKFTCIHIRRGDFSKVACHLVSISELIKFSINFSNVCDNVVILSDEKLDKDVVKKLKDGGYKNVIFEFGGSPKRAHNIMRHANVLITSNSQFSFSAALLSENITFIPKKWFSNFRNKPIELMISNFDSDFNFLNRI